MTKWFNITIDEKNSIVTLEPVDKLSKEDFDEVKNKVNDLIEKTWKINWIILYIKNWPSWDGLSWYLAHFSFVKDMHKKVPYVAFVTNSMLGEVGEHIWNHFVNATVKHFKYDELEKAKQWILSDEDWKINHWIDIEDYLDKWYIKLVARWKLTDEDYKKAIPEIEKLISKIPENKLHILIDITDFKWWTFKASIDDFEFWKKHKFDLWKIAFFGNKNKYVDLITKLSNLFSKSEIKDFETENEAIEWLLA